jgi:hypothetical protein
LLLALVSDVPMSLILRPTRLHWLDENVGDLADLCIHSPVEVAVNGTPLVMPSDGDWTVSAAALYLLRTLSREHTPSAPVGDHLFPCCGFTMYDVGEPDVVIVGCVSGADFGVTRVGDRVVLSRENVKHELPFVDWRDGVWEFADAVRAFYDGAPTREPSSREDAKGNRAFWAEWARRRAPA